MLGFAVLCIIPRKKELPTYKFSHNFCDRVGYHKEKSNHTVPPSCYQHSFNKIFACSGWHEAYFIHQLALSMQHPN